MKYTRNFLTKNAKQDKNDILSKGYLYELLNNEKTLEELAIQITKKFKQVKGHIHIIKRVDDQINVLTDLDRNTDSTEFLMNSLVYKKIKETKKPFFNDSVHDGVYAGFPLNLKGKFIGGFIIEEKQKITEWEELYEYLNMLVFAFRYYHLIEREREMGIKDPITGLYNERYFYYHLEVEEAKYSRTKSELTLLLVRIDNIKEINEQFDFRTEEKVLKYIGNVVKKQSRKEDMPAKLDRNVFAILLSSTPIEGGEVMERRILNMLDNEFEYQDKKINLQITTACKQFENHNTRENFIEETLALLDK